MDGWMDALGMSKYFNSITKLRCKVLAVLTAESFSLRRFVALQIPTDNAGTLLPPSSHADK
jgi:hypothetical protein